MFNHIRGLKSRYQDKEQGCHVVQSYDTGRREDVYNITEPEVHEVIYSGIVSCNCGEYAAPPFSVCNLLTGSAIGNDISKYNDMSYLSIFCGIALHNDINPG